MSFIYQPSGKAREYADLSCNLYTGCDNGCFYCFNKLSPWYKRERYNNPQLRQGILQGIEKELKKGKVTTDTEILVCFYCDPYPRIENGETREALLIFEAHKAKISILTKNGIRAYRDFDILARNNWKFGVTIAGSEKSRKEQELFAESIHNRFAALARAKSMGIYTWVSVEPVIKPLETLVIISLLKGKVDEFRVGKINHFPMYEKGVDWQSFLMVAEALLKDEKYTIKESLLVAAGRKK